MKLIGRCRQTMIKRINFRLDAMAMAVRNRIVEPEFIFIEACKIFIQANAMGILAWELEVPYVR